MYENTIYEILNNDKTTRKTFIGVYARDELPEFIDYPACLVMNNENRSKPGEHWLALAYNNKGHCYFFDSYGNPPKYYNIEKYILKTSKTWQYNKKRIQGFSSYCGFYCILFLLFFNRNNIKDFFKKFGLDYIKNDQFIKNEIEKRL